MTDTKETILQLLREFIAQRSGLQFANYGNVTAFRSDQRRITKDGNEARQMLDAVALRGEITAQQIIAASKTAFSGRLTIEAEGAGYRLSYCTGQYFPVEYRRAACAVLSAALWRYWSEAVTPQELDLAGGSKGAAICKKANRELGRGIAARWFSN